MQKPIKASTIKGCEVEVFKMGDKTPVTAAGILSLSIDLDDPSIISVGIHIEKVKQSIFVPLPTEIFRSAFEELMKEDNV